MGGPTGRAGIAVVAIGAGVALAVLGAAAGADGPGPLVLGTLVAATIAAVPLAVTPRSSASAADEAPDRAARGREALHREFDRSRRYGHPLTLVVIRAAAGVDEPADGGVAGAAPEDRLGGHLRLVDATWREDGVVYALLPETDGTAARRLVERIRADDPGLVPAEATGIATFPTEAMTIRALVDRAARPAVDRERPAAGAPVDASTPQRSSGQAP